MSHRSHRFVIDFRVLAGASVVDVVELDVVEGELGTTVLAFAG